MARALLPNEEVTMRMEAPFRTQGTERSIPPIRMTKVCPAATRPTKEAIVSTARIPEGLAKPGRTAWPIANSTMDAKSA